MLKRTIASFIVATAVSSAAFGAQFSTPGESGFYGGLGVGGTKSDVNAGPISGAKDDKDTAWKAFGGYQFNRYIGVEGGYIDLGKSSVVGPAGAASFDNQAWQASVVGSMPINNQFALTGKLGIARTDTDTVANIGAQPLLASDHNTDPTYGLGVRYDINKSVGVRAEWERLRTSTGAFGKNDIDVYSINGIYRFN
ncbi:MAG TPA: outer membrane beta-barrel protein [Burkholderiales bacterium]|nr:outer membrane beta-barrel protein [Burkholderiales bacterium]